MPDIFKRMEWIEKSRKAKLRVKAQVGAKREQLESALSDFWMRKLKSYGSDMPAHEFKAVDHAFLSISHDFIRDYCITSLNSCKWKCVYLSARKRTHINQKTL